MKLNIKKALQRAVLAQQKGRFQEAEKILAEEMPMLPIYFYVRASLRQPSVKGWWPNVLDHHPYKYVYLKDD